MSLPTAIPRWQRRAVLPRGRVLGDAAWRARHTALVVLLLVHVPVLLALAATGAAGPGPLLAGGPAAVALLLATTGRTRRTRSVALVAGLMWCSGVLVVATGGAAGAHVHAVLVVLAAAAYEDRVPLLLAAGAGALGYGVGGRLAPVEVFGPAGAVSATPLAVLAVLLVAAAAVAACSWWPVDVEGARRRSAAALRERELAVAAELEAAAAVKSQLLTVVSHEFRTPLASITGLARTLSARVDELDREAVQACLGGIDHHARRLTGLVHNVLEASGEIDVDHTAVTDLASTARAVVDEALAAHGDRVRVRVDVPPRLEGAVGPRAARHILANVCDNAVKFAPRGALAEVAGSEHDDEVAVVVANESSMLCERTLERCFEPFVQADSSDTRRVDGMGLGLHVARRLARAHGGDLTASIHGRRVLFRLSLPRPGRLSVRAEETFEVLLDDLDSPVH